MKKLMLLILGMGLLCLNLNGQVPKYKYKAFALGIAPGFGTNGIDGGKYRNGIAVHLISGYSGGTEGFEFAGISNFNKGEVNGLQFAGFTNIIGGNALEFGKKLRRQAKLMEARKKAELHGIQVAGFMNMVTGNVAAWQMAGGFNMNERHTNGVQLAGISNMSFEKTTGVQLAGLSNFSGNALTGLQLAVGVNHANHSTTGIQLSGLGNLSVETVTGMQITGGANIAQEELLGIQLGGINYARTILGPHSKPLGSKPGLQIGLINLARNMDGVQVGLINIAKRSHGAHFGLINIFSNAGRVNQRNGPAYGLLNFGDQVHFRTSTNELFTMNVSVATGNSQNNLVKSELNLHLTQNSLIYSRNFNEVAEVKGKPTWSLGYGIEKYVYNPKMGIPALVKFLNYGVQFMHVNWDKKLQKDLSLLTRLRFVVGGKPYRIPILSTVYWYGGFTLNTYTSSADLAYHPNFGRIASFNFGKNRANVWLGYVIGVHLY